VALGSQARTAIAFPVDKVAIFAFFAATRIR